MNRKPNA